MAKQIIWSLQAQDQKKQILIYWRQRNKSAAYSKKLNQLFKESATIISEYPAIGKITDYEGVRIKTVRDYLIFYEEAESHIYILTVWDSRQDPQKIKL